VICVCDCVCDSLRHRVSASSSESLFVFVSGLRRLPACSTSSACSACRMKLEDALALVSSIHAHPESAGSVEEVTRRVVRDRDGRPVEFSELRRVKRVEVLR